MCPSEDTFIERKEEYENFSRSIQIGIYGYFSESRKTYLENLKEFLKSRNLNAQMSTDFENRELPVVSVDADALESSKMLYKNSKIHIFVLIPSAKDQLGRFLDSVSMEYGWVSMDKPPYVGIYVQQGFDVSTLAQGAMDEMRDYWTNEKFDNISDIFVNIAKYCDDVIRNMFLSFK